MTSPGETLARRLPPVRGRLEIDRPLADLTWFRVGGPADVLFSPADEEDLAAVSWCAG
jgi:UDP-N-acetylmuramate dehydrogenase